MKTLEQQMSVYLRYHRDPRNRLTHFIGVPLITFSLFIPLAWVSLRIGGLSITLAHVFFAAVLVYYLLLDVAVALALAVVVGALVYFAQRVADLGYATGWAVFLAAFVVGWIAQLLGHYFEGKRPALLDNFWQIFVAPLFLMMETFAALGFKRDRLRSAEELTAR
jgi:uncharacterized membrane protein YGL010W